MVFVYGADEGCCPLDVSLEDLSFTVKLHPHIKTAEHPIGTLSPCGTSIVYLLAEFEPLTMAALLVT